MELAIFLGVLLLVGAYFATPNSCYVCGQSIKKTYYTWKIEGKKRVLCPKCNTQMERKVSKQAFSKKFG
ncbi:hypothetical protein R50072_37040 [Simiduia litorea]